MTPNGRVAAAALACVGAPFRLHGRVPEHGLDCVGVAAWALRAGGWGGLVPTGYALRGGDERRTAMALGAALCRGCGNDMGAVLLVRAGPGQLHLAVKVADGVVHADAALRRVVMRPGPLPWPLIGAWTVDPA